MLINRVWRKSFEPFLNYSFPVSFPFLPTPLLVFQFLPKSGSYLYIYLVLCIKFGFSTFISFGNISAKFSSGSHMHTHIHYFHYPTTFRWRKYCFRSKFSPDLYVLRLRKSEIWFMETGLCVYLYVCACVCVCLHACEWVGNIFCFRHSLLDTQIVSKNNEIAFRKTQKLAV